MRNRAITALLLVILGACTTLPSSIHRSSGRGDVVMLLGAGGFSGGTGFQLRTEDGFEYLVTNDHVCALADGYGTMAAISEDGALHRTRILYRPPTTDLCFTTTIDGLNSFRVAPSLDTEGPVRALGHPSLRGLTETAGQALKRNVIDVVVGEVGVENPCNAPKNTIVSTFFGSLCLARINAVETTTLIEPGSSGSPALDSVGLVVGVFFAMDRGDPSHSFFVPLEDLHQELLNARK